MVHTRPADSASSATETARAAQPATQENSQSLRMLLSKQSLKIKQLKVIVLKPWDDTYSYCYGSVDKTTTIWRCVLVDATNPGNYCMGEFKKTTKNTPAFETFSKAKVEGSTLLLSNISLVENVKTQYMSCSVRVAINMASSTHVSIFGTPCVVQPVPNVTVSETKDIKQSQSFDLTAFILSRTASRNGGPDRKAFDLELADGSTDMTCGKVQTVKLTVFAADSEVAAYLQTADKSIEQHDPVSSFNVRGNSCPDENTYTFASARKGFFMTVAESPRATEMRTSAAELYNLQEKVAVPQKQIFQVKASPLNQESE